MRVYKVVILAPAWEELEEISDYDVMTVGPVLAKI